MTNCHTRPRGCEAAPPTAAMGHEPSLRFHDCEGSTAVRGGSADVGNWHDGELKERQSQFGFAPVVQTSTCSAMARASSTSMPRYLTVLSIFVCPNSSCTARKLPVRR